MRTADSTFSPRKRRPTLIKRSGASVTKKLCPPFPVFLAIAFLVSIEATSLAVSSAESTRRTSLPINFLIAFFSKGECVQPRIYVSMPLCLRLPR
jgi:hypothetical protein